MQTVEASTALFHNPVRPLDLDFARSRFPALAGEWVFLDNAGGAAVLQEVADRVREYLLSTSVTTGGLYEASLLATERVAGAVRAAAALVNADPGEIVLGPSATQLLANLARAMAESFKPDDEIVVTNADHEANISPWIRVAAERGAVVKFWKVRPETQELDLADLDPLMTERTRLVCVAQVSNVTGSIAPVGEIVQRVHERGARVYVDGVAYAPHRRVDVRALDADFYVLSLYKVFGPRLGLLYGKRQHLLELSNINHLFLPQDAIPYKLQPGGFSYELAHGVPAIVEYLEELGRRAGGEGNLLEAAFDAIAAHEARAAAPMLDALAGRPGVRVLGWPDADPARRVATVSLIAEGRDSAGISQALADRKIGVRHGDFHARRLLQDLGLAGGSGAVRISLAHYNTAQEMERVVEALDEVL